MGRLTPPDVAMEMAKLNRIKIYSICVGSTLELKDEVNTDIGPRRQKQQLEFNEHLLQDLAKQTGGQYFNAKNKEALRTVYASINQLEKSKIKKMNYERAEDKNLSWVSAALALRLIEVVLRYVAFRKFA